MEDAASKEEKEYRNKNQREVKHNLANLARGRPHQSCGSPELITVCHNTDHLCDWPPLLGASKNTLCGYVEFNRPRLWAALARHRRPGADSRNRCDCWATVWRKDLELILEEIQIRGLCNYPFFLIAYKILQIDGAVARSIFVARVSVSFAFLMVDLFIDCVPQVAFAIAKQYLCSIKGGGCLTRAEQITAWKLVCDHFCKLPRKKTA